MTFVGGQPSGPQIAREPERWPAWVATAMAASSIALVVLGDLGWFRPWLALGVVATAVAASLFLWHPRRPARPPWRLWLAVGILTVEVALVAPGSENVVGTRDPGVYLATALAIMRNGSLIYEDPTVRILGKTVAPSQAAGWLYSGSNGATLRYPGQIFVRDLRAGTVEPGFLPVLPIWMALAAGVGGVEAALHVSAGFGVLALGYLMLAARAVGKAAGWPPNSWLWGGAILAASFPQVWWSREPMAESALAAFTWMAAWGLVHWAQGGGARWAALTSLTASAALLTRADGVLVAVPVGVALALLPAPGRRTGLYLLALGLLAFLVHATTVAPIYTGITYGAFTLGRALPGLAAASLVALAVAAVLGPPVAERASLRSSFPQAAGSEAFSTSGLVAQRVATAIGVGVVLAAMATGQAPGVGRDLALGAASPLAWVPAYLGWPSVILAAVGGLTMGWYGVPPRVAPALLLGALPLLFYLPDPLVTGDHPWLSRRLVPAGIPLLALAAGLGAGVLLGARGWPARAAGPVAAAVLLAAASVVSVQQLRGVYGAPRHGAGTLDGLASLATAVPRGSVVVFPTSAAGPSLAMPLQAIHGIPTVAIPASALSPEIAETLQRWSASGIGVYWAADATSAVELPAEVGARSVAIRTVRWRSADGGARPPPLDLRTHEVRLALYHLTFRGEANVLPTTTDLGHGGRLPAP